MKVMKKLLVGVLFLMGVFVESSNAQSAFNKAMKDVHISTLNTCGMVKSKEHNRDQILQSFKKLKKQYADIQKQYVNNPPPEYAKDKLFASYFVQFNEIINSQIALIQKENYRVAAMNCSRFCMNFQKMHAINGTLDLTDMLFAWNMKITMTQSMINADNISGAQENMKQIPMLYEKVIALKSKKNDGNFNKSFETIDILYQSWLSAMESKDYKKATEEYNKFFTSFPKVFKQSI